MDTTKTKTTRAPAAPPADPRSPYAKALDHAAESLTAMVPDRTQGLSSSLLATPSLLSSLATELDHRVRARFPQADYELRSHLERLPKLLRSATLKDYELKPLLEAIARGIHLLESPPPPASSPDHWRELGRDLGVKIADDAAAAAPVLGSAIAGANTQDRRTLDAWRDLVAGLGLGWAGPFDGPLAAATKRARHALSGYGLPPVRADDASFRATLAELAPPLPPVNPAGWGMNSSAPDWLRRLASAIGVAFPSYPGEIERRIRDDAESADQRLRSRMTGPELDDARRALDRRTNESYGAMHHAYAVGQEVARADVVARIDEALRALEESEAGSLRCWWTRRLRADVVDLAVSDSSFMGTGGHIEAWTIVQRFGINFTPAAGSSSGKTAKETAR